MSMIDRLLHGNYIKKWGRKIINLQQVKMMESHRENPGGHDGGSGGSGGHGQPESLWTGAIATKFVEFQGEEDLGGGEDAGKMLENVRSR